MTGLMYISIFFLLVIFFFDSDSFIFGHHIEVIYLDVDFDWLSGLMCEYFTGKLA